MQNNSVVIVNAYRSPIGSFNGYYKDLATPELASHVIKACYARAKLAPDQIEHVTMGCVLPAGLGQAPARQAALIAELANSTPCVTVNKMCASGLEAIIQAHSALKAGSYNVAIAGGMENMTRAPYLVPKARFGYRYGHATMLDHMQKDGLEDAYDQSSMGAHAEKCVQKFGLTRELQDAFALESYTRAKEATEHGAFIDEIIPIKIRDEDVHQDEGLLKIKPDKIPTLKAAFVENGTVTAANASSIADGAAAITLSTEDYAKTNQLQPLAKILGHASFAAEPSWFSTAPIFAIEKLLKNLNWTMSDVDLFEINEAFACVTMATIEALKIPPNIINIHGGATVLGHPIGATGARILVTLVHALRRHNLKRGIAALCIGGGEAQAIAIELM